MTRRVCASIPAGNDALSSAGSVGIWPVRKTQPPTATAWLNGPTGAGAPGIIKNSIMAAPQQPLFGRGAGDPFGSPALARRGRRPACVGDREASPCDNPDVAARQQFLAGNYR